MTIVAAVTYAAVIIWAMTRLHRALLLRGMRREVKARQHGLITEAMTRDRARRHGYLMSPQRISDPILDPGAQEPPPDQRRELREWRAAWIEPNEEFILETDRILNDIEWARLGSAAQDAGGANDRWEQAS